MRQRRPLKFTFVDLLQIVLIVLKLAGVLNVSWWLILSPVFITVSILLLSDYADKKNKEFEKDLDEIINEPREY